MNLRLQIYNKEMKNYLPACLALRYLGTRWKRSNKGKYFETDRAGDTTQSLFFHTEYKNKNKINLKKFQYLLRRLTWKEI